MSDFKSKLPDLKELSSMTSKLFKGLKSSVSEIIKDYKEKRAVDPTTEEPAEKVKTEEVKKETAKPAEKKEETNTDSTDKQA
jgi:cation transport regulator ChaB